MKRRLALIIVITFVISLCAIVGSILLTKEDEVSLTTVKKSYCYISDSSQTQDFIVDMYVSSKRSFITNNDNLSECYLKDNDNELEVKINEIVQNGDILKINDKKYYLYQFYFTIPLITDTDCEFSFLDAKLSLNYPDELVEINIGSFYYLKVKDYSNYISKLTLLKVKPVVNYLNNNKTLSGLNIKMFNNYDKSIKITNIKILSSNTIISLNESVIIEEEINSKDNISTLLGYKYDYKDYEEEQNISIELANDESVDYLFPIKYINDYSVNTAGILIEYTVNNETYKYYCDEVLFFQTTTIKLSENDFVINTYDLN